MKILIAGARGLLGSELMVAINERGHEAKVFTGDIAEEANVKAQVGEIEPDAIINAAALTEVKVCEQEPDKARSVNAVGQSFLVAAARERAIPVIYVSTVSVFSGEGDYKEEDIPNPQNVYNKTKREGELFTLEYEKGMVVRVNILGIHRDGSRGRAFLEWMTDTIRANKDLTLYTDSKVNPLSNITLADLITRLIEKPVPYRILHLGSSDVISKADIGEMVLAHFPDYTGKVTLMSQPPENTQPREIWMNVDRATALFGRLPSVQEEVGKVMERFTRS